MQTNWLHAMPKKKNNRYFTTISGKNHFRREQFKNSTNSSPFLGAIGGRPQIARPSASSAVRDLRLKTLQMPHQATSLLGKAPLEIEKVRETSKVDPTDAPYA